MLLLLLLCPIFKHCWAQHPDAEAVQRGAGLNTFHLVLEHLGLLRSESAAAVLRGPFRHGPAFVPHPFEPYFGILTGERPPSATPILIFRSHWLAL